MKTKKAILEAILEIMYRYNIRIGRARLSLKLDVENEKIEKTR